MTQKNLTEISELLRSEDLCYKKCCNYVSEVNDEVLKCKLGTWANNHRRRYEALLDYLNTHD